MFSGDGIEWHGRRYLSGVRLPGWSPSVLRTDGTAAGTEIYEEGAGGPFELWGRLAWSRDMPYPNWQIVATDGTGPPTPVLDGPLPYEPRFLVAGDELYAFGQEYSPAEISMWALSRAGEYRHLGKLPGYVLARAPAQRGSELLFLVSANGAFELWRIDAARQLFEQVSADPAVEWPGGVSLGALPEGPLVPWLDGNGVARPGRVTSEGRLVAVDSLVLAGTAGSSPHLIGETGGRALLFARTAAEGPVVWVSDGTLDGTRPTAVRSQCLPEQGYAPRLVPPALVADCQADGTVAVWDLEGAMPVAVHLQISPSTQYGYGEAPRMVRLGSRVVYTHRTLGIRSRDLLSDVEAALSPCISEVFRAGAAALFACSGKVWTTNGTAAGTAVLIETGASSVDFVETGSKVVVLGYQAGAWLSDGTASGSTAIAPLAGALPAGPASTWTCAWDGEGIVRLDLKDGSTVRLEEAVLGSIYPIVPSHGPTRVLRSLEPYPRGRTWRCDGTPEGTREIPELGPVPWRLGADSVANDDRFVWHHSLEAERERLLRLPLEGGAWETVVDRLTPLGDEADRYSLPPLGIAADRLWISLADESTGREPWALDLRPRELFQDGFEGGDTSAWSGSD